MSRNRKILETVAMGLGELLPQFVFVGGSVLELYVPVTIRAEARFTEDVDCIVEVASLALYYEMETQLRKRGFQEDMEEDAPICRKLYQGIKVDIMPTDENILQFSNRWYKEGFLHAQNYSLSEQVTIQILSIPYFIASKLEAFFSPYRKYRLDMYASHDFEDIIYILDHCNEVITQVKKSNIVLRMYLATQFQFLLKQKSLIYALAGILRDSENEERLLNIIKKLAIKPSFSI